MAITVRELERRVIALEATVKALAKDATAADPNILQWRRSALKLLAGPPPQTNDRSASFAWGRWQTGSSGSFEPVTYCIDGGRRESAPPSFNIGALQPGNHQCDFFLGSNVEPELVHYWHIY